MKLQINLKINHFKCDNDLEIIKNKITQILNVNIFNDENPENKIFNLITNDIIQKK